MKLLSVILCLFFVLGVSLGCVPSDNGNYLSFRKVEIEARVYGSLWVLQTDGYEPLGVLAGKGSDGLEFSFEADVYIKGDSMKVCFTSPVSMAGFEVIREGEKTCARLDGISVEASGGEYDGFIGIAESFLIGNEVVTVNPLGEGKVEVYVGDNTKVRSVYVFDKTNGLPNQIATDTELLRLNMKISK